MILKNKAILLISPETWSHIFVSKHHYAVHLSLLQNNVFFLNPPAAQYKLASTNYTKLFEVEYPGFPRGFRFFPSWIQRIITRNIFEKLQELTNTKFDVVWSFDNSVFFDFSALPKSVFCISHIVDLNQDLQLKRAASSAHICLGSSEEIVRTLRKFQQFTFKINHGVALSNKAELSSGKGTRLTAVYSGNLSIPYIDWELLTNLVVSFPQVDFIFLGPFQVSHYQISKLQHKENVSFKGHVSSSELQKYYANADVLLLTYKAEEYKEQVSNPHKVMEYLMSGKVIVATYTEEYSEQAKEELLAMSLQQKQFILLFENVLSKLDYWNSEELQSKRRAFALNNTYSKQLERIENIINQNLRNE